MSKTKFPDFSHPGRNHGSNRYWSYADNGTLSDFDWEYHDKDIQDWFKRCIEDFPTEKQTLEERPDDWEWTGTLVMRRNKWFRKWFSQFTTKGEEDDVAL